MKTFKQFNFSRLLLLSSLTLILFSCSSRDEFGDEVDPLLLNCWKHSYEEDISNEIKVYRPCDYIDFSPSWYRSTYILKEDNDCEYSVLSPIDAHYVENGKWDYLQSSDVILVTDEKDSIIVEMEVVDLEENKLTVTY